MSSLKVTDLLPFSLFVVDDDFRILWLNRHAWEQSKIPTEEPIGQSCHRFYYGRAKLCPYCPVINEWKDTEKKEPVEKIIQIQREGKERSYRITFYHRGDSPMQILERIEDISGEREKQEDALRMENLAALGTMISGIAHELNNPLTGMGLTLQSLEANLESMTPRETEAKLALIRKDLIRSSRIVADILSFARPGSLKLTKSDLLQTIHKAKATILRLYPVLARRVEWDIRAAEEGFILPYHQEKIERLFINLFQNSIRAFDYSPGHVRVDLRRTKRWVHIIVEDDGGGIPAETINRIFQPFYTDGKGSGLGLTICHSIVREHQGLIRVKSHSGKTWFFVSLPSQGKE